jgi:tetratricopeptide (TPR) repeat protein
MMQNESFVKRAFRMTGILSTVILSVTLIGFAQDPTGRPTSPPKDKRLPKRAPVKTEPVPISVILTVLTDPPESTVFINGDERGVSSAEGRIQFEKLALGQYSVEVKKDGFRPAGRIFQAGADSPTLVFRLEPDLDDVVKQFDALISTGKLAGAESPNAFEIVDRVSNQHPNRPEVIRMRGVLSARLIDVASPAANRSVTAWRALSREEIVAALDAATLSASLKAEDKRAQAMASYFRGVIALRDWLQGQFQSQTEPNKQGSEVPPESTGLATARTELERAIAQEDAWAAPRYQLGVVHFYLRDYDNAQAAFVKVSQLEPGWSQALIWLGTTYYASGKHKEAIEAYRRAIQMESGSAAAYAGLGLARSARGEKNAEKDIEKASQLDPTSGLPHLNMGIILAKSKKSKDRARAVEELRMAIQKNSQNLEFQNRIAEELISSLQNRNK